MNLLYKRIAIRLVWFSIYLTFIFCYTFVWIRQGHAWARYIFKPLPALTLVLGMFASPKIALNDNIKHHFGKWILIALIGCTIGDVILLGTPEMPTNFENQNFENKISTNQTNTAYPTVSMMSGILVFSLAQLAFMIALGRIELNNRWIWTRLKRKTYFIVTFIVVVPISIPIWIWSLTQKHQSGAPIGLAIAYSAYMSWVLFVFSQSCLRLKYQHKQHTMHSIMDKHATTSPAVNVRCKVQQPVYYALIAVALLIYVVSDLMLGLNASSPSKSKHFTAMLLYWTALCVLANVATHIKPHPIHLPISLCDDNDIGNSNGLDAEAAFSYVP